MLTESLIVPPALQPANHKMMQVVGASDILFVCLDTLRYDVAVQEEASGGTPVLNQYGLWQKRQAPGNFTYPSHHAMFAGFLPCPFEAKNVTVRTVSSLILYSLFSCNHSFIIFA